MAQELRVPQLGVTMTEGIISAWLVGNGESVEEGQAVYTLATDKTETDIEAPTAGTVEILGEVDETYEVGVLIGKIV